MHLYPSTVPLRTVHECTCVGEDAGHSIMQVSRYPDGPLVVTEDSVDRFPRVAGDK